MKNKHKIMASCENKKCSFNNMVEVTVSINADCALETANNLNNKKILCSKCGNYLSYFPFTTIDDNYFDYYEY